MEDREILRGIFNMLGVLIERMTGEIPVVRMRGEDGQLHPTYYNAYELDWVNPSHVGVASPPDGLGGLPPTDSSNHGALDAKEKESLQPVE